MSGAVIGFSIGLLCGGALTWVALVLIAHRERKDQPRRWIEPL